MAFNYTPLNESQKIKDMYPKVNDIGKFIQDTVGRDNVITISAPDFNDILASVTASGFYYVTTSKNQPEGENWNGFIYFVKRSDTIGKVYYMPYNNNNTYVKTYNGLGETTSWEKIKLDTGDLFNYGNTLDITTLSASTTQFGTILNPPKEDLSEGWINYKESEGNRTGILEYNPINSSSTFKKIKKRPIEDQNPNLIIDSLFEKASMYFPTWSNRDDSIYTWDTISSTDAYVTNERLFQGNNTLKITNEGTGTYPIVRSKPLVIGEDVQPGDTLTFSTYLYVPDKASMGERWFYLLAGKYPDKLEDVNSQIEETRIYSSDIEEGEWKRFSVTFTVPQKTATVTKIAMSLRINNSSYGAQSGMIGYFALPKLEVGSKATPFITHEDDDKQFDEIWTNWDEVISKEELQKHSVTDIYYDDYFKYRWTKEKAGNRTLEDLLITVPQGYHTFYAQAGIEGTLGKSIRGTIQVDHDAGDITKDRKFVSATYTDWDGNIYTKYYDKGWTPLRKSEMATLLWEGNLDLASFDTAPLKDSIDNYDIIEVTYWTRSAGHDATKRIDMKATKIIYVRDFNLANTEANTNVSFYEGYCTFPTSTTVKAEMSKALDYDGSTNTSKTTAWNVKGYITISKIRGINTI